MYGHPKGARHWYTMVLSLLTPAGFIKDGTCTFNSLLRRSWFLLSSSEGVVGAGRRFVLHLPAFCLQVVHYYSQKAQGISLPLSFKVALDRNYRGTSFFSSVYFPSAWTEDFRLIAAPQGFTCLGHTVYREIRAGYSAGYPVEHLVTSEPGENLTHNLRPTRGWV